MHSAEDYAKARARVGELEELEEELGDPAAPGARAAQGVVPLRPLCAVLPVAALQVLHAVVHGAALHGFLHADSPYSAPAASPSNPANPETNTTRK